MTSAALTLTTDDFVIGHVVQFSFPETGPWGERLEHPGRHELIVGIVRKHIGADCVEILVASCDPQTKPGNGRPGETVCFDLRDVAGLIDITALEAQ